MKLPNSNMAAHLNQKPQDLTEMIVKASTKPGDVVWEPFGGLFTTSLVSNRLKRQSYAAELDASIFSFARDRLRQDFSVTQKVLPLTID